MRAKLKRLWRRLDRINEEHTDILEDEQHQEAVIVARFEANAIRRDAVRDRIMAAGGKVPRSW